MEYYSPSPPYRTDNHYHNTDNDNNNNNKAFIILFLVIFLFFVRGWWDIRWRQWSARNNNNDINENLINQNNQNNQNNQENIEKKEIKFTNELYDKECTICLEYFNENEMLYELICEHYYHKNCIDDWLSKKNTCPLCRLNLV